MKKRALVTGSSRGIGRALALSLAKDGYEVIVHCAGNVAKAEEVVEAIKELGGKASTIKADLCDMDNAKQLAKEMGTIDVLVLNASVQYRNIWTNITLEECYNKLNCNFVASMLLIQAVVEIKTPICICVL